MKDGDQNFEMLKLFSNIANSDNKVSNTLFKFFLAVNVEKQSIESQWKCTKVSLLGMSTQLKWSINDQYLDVYCTEKWTLLIWFYLRVMIMLFKDNVWTVLKL